ncbi:putative FlaG/YvyC family protein [Catalinimonas alkaloidigena]|uniref:hypothetical protein n=1 Tax=Catalinimonas alkaloidigena TaxID=1075417 RepID=UPI002405FFDB|nr:hypothetical protein [Catalinimonas alkaloidigena]MDF9797668.1 putative FlaG/YvyC family protein [Catalinimonas alkaloidigena]
MKTIKYLFLLPLIWGSLLTEVYANTSPDTIIIRLSEQEEIKIISSSGNELKQLSQYDINKIIRELNEKANEGNDNLTITMQDSSGTQYILERNYDDEEEHNQFREKNGLEEKVERLERELDRLSESIEDKKYEDRDVKFNKKHKSGTSSTFIFEFGLNNYLSNGKFPSDESELYSVNPIVSWYVSLGGMNSTHIAGPLSIDWGANVSWYNFKFENERTRIEKLDDGVFFYEDPTPDISPIKSKLVVPYLNVSLVPMFIFGKNRSSDWEPFSYHENDGFRIGLGMYAGYRLGPHSKAVYKNDGDRRRDKDWNSFYLNSWRYGARLQMGFKSIDIFANYDLNKLFAEGKGPQLNAFSFGIIL